MTLSREVKYVVVRVACALALIPLRLGAQQTVPVTFREGDVISAGVMNSILERVEGATNSMTSDDLVGTWTVTQIVPFNGQPGNGGCRFSVSCNISGTTDAADGMSRSRTDVVTITKSGSTYIYSQATVSSFTSAHTNTPDGGNVSVIGETAIFRNSGGTFQFYYAKKKSLVRVVLQDIQSGSGSFNMVILDKRNIAPLPPNNLLAAVSSSTVTLSWTDQSVDETGFKIQRKTSATAAWTDVLTTAANATAHSVTGLIAGPYWFRVLSTNTHGDSSSSSEVQVTVQ